MSFVMIVIHQTQILVQQLVCKVFVVITSCNTQMASESMKCVMMAIKSIQMDVTMRVNHLHRVEMVLLILVNDVMMVILKRVMVVIQVVKMSPVVICIEIQMVVIITMEHQMMNNANKIPIAH